MPASRVDLLDNLAAALGAASADDDVRPFGRERGRDRAADVAGSSVTSAVLCSSRVFIWEWLSSHRRFYGVGSTGDGEFAGAVGLSAGRADGQRMELCAAAVLEDDRLGTGIDVAVSPLLQGEQDRLKFRAGVREQVLVARRSLGIKATLDYAPLLELAQP